MTTPKILIPMSDHGHDPTEVAIPYKIFTAAEFDVHFATETGQSPRLDARMLYGVTGALLGANAEAKAAAVALQTSSESRAGSFAKPLAWSREGFSLGDYDLVFLPGGHERGVRQIIGSERMHELLAEYFPLTRRAAAAAETGIQERRKKRAIAAICHGVQVLAFTPSPDVPGKSIIHDARTTALPHWMEQGIWWLTRLWLGDYYKTFGRGSKSVQQFVEEGLDDRALFVVPEGWGGKPFVVEDERYRYLSARYPPDAWVLAERAVELVREGIGE